jgi:hypothetical protein
MVSPVPPRHSKPRSRRVDARSVQIGVAATILVHVALLFLAPRLATMLDHDTSVNSTDAEAARAFEIEFAPENFTLPEKPKPPLNFVEANPNAPDNVPDLTNNFAAQNQQVAQEKPTPDSESDTPALDGDPTKKSTTIVTGQLTAPQPPSPPTPPATPDAPETPEQLAARRAQDPLAGAEKITGDDTAGLGSNIAKFSPNSRDVPERVEGVADAKTDTGAIAGVYYKVDRTKPRPRQTLPTNVTRARPSPLLKNDLGTQNIGAVAYDAKWSSYGEYLKKLIETVQVQWERILDRSTTFPPRGTQVEVAFRLNSAGEIAEVLKVDGSGNLQARSACVSAISARAPYGAWTEDMIAVLGTSQDLTFTFTYE